jgi:hypothetical protein
MWSPCSWGSAEEDLTPYVPHAHVKQELQDLDTEGNTRRITSQRRLRLEAIIEHSTPLEEEVLSFMNGLIERNMRHQLPPIQRALDMWRGSRIDDVGLRENLIRAQRAAMKFGCMSKNKNKTVAAYDKERMRLRRGGGGF